MAKAQALALDARKLWIYNSFTIQARLAVYPLVGARHSWGFPMMREIETAIALLLIPVSAYCLWRYSYATGAIAATIAQTFSVILYMRANGRRSDAR